MNEKTENDVLAPACEMLLGIGTMFDEEQDKLAFPCVGQ